MAILAIRKFGEPVIRQRAREVAAVGELHRALIKNMLETMRDAPGVGLAAPQVGVLDRIFVWEVGEEHGAVINPVITSRSGETVTEEEGCLSLPGLTYPVERSAAVTVEGLDENGAPLSMAADELLARVVQHEVDHLDGVLFIDRLPDTLRRDALRILRDQALGLPVGTPTAAPVEESL